jgi:hypothetical protein
MSPIERAAVGEVPSEATARVADGQRQRREQKKDREPGVKTGTTELTSDEQREVSKLAEVDRQVRAHEQAHMIAASGLVRGGATFTYRTGPDGKQYAVAGEVQIHVPSGSGDPEQLVAQAQAIEAAALAPADPSPQDRLVAAQARRMAAEARRKVQQKYSPVSNQEGTEPRTPVELEGQPERTGESVRPAKPDPRVRGYSSGRDSSPGLFLSYNA